ncbi:MAG: diaminopimelate epimerase, partial [Clostridia bacterium]|nr:diaminopimelate epimerase [Clostridia bacterium]
FTKMQGLGNDYLYVYGPVPENIRDLCVRLSDRHFGAGSDGMIFISPSRIADFRMRIFNADGSEAKMCGNGIRCVGRYVYEKGYTDKRRLTVETLSGIRKLNLEVHSGQVERVSVDMGTYSVSQDRTLRLDGKDVTLTPVSVGNPHAVLFVSDAEKAPVETLGPMIEHHPDFPDGVNVEFVQVLSPGSLRMRIWERGSGVTMACGTGACASVGAAVEKGFCMPESPVSVRLDGGTLLVCAHTDRSLTMTGPAVTVYEGETALC